MKRISIISALLTVAMLLTLIMIPMMVTADAAGWTAPSTFTTSGDFFNDDLYTLYASYGTPTIDGEFENEQGVNEWANALTTRFDYSRMLLTRPNKARQSVFLNVYMMWDEDNLYILEDRKFDKAVYKAGCTNFWGGDTCTCWLISLDTPWTESGKSGASNMVCVHTGNFEEDGLGYVTRQDKYYTANTGAATTVGYKLFDEYSLSYTTLTETGFIMETAISWDALDNYTPNFEATAGTVFGMMVYFKPSWGDNGNHCPDINTPGGATNSAGFQKVELLAKDAENPTTPSVEPDFDWFKNSDGNTYYIYDAADLLGLLELSHIHGSNTILANAIGYSDAADRKFQGKTIEIMADIDLNPNTTFNADGTWTGATPVNGWSCIQDFGGTIDGNGHTISGLYLPNGMVYSQGPEPRYIGLVGRGGAGLTIKDLSLTNGYLSADKSTSNQTAASFLAVAHHYNGAGTMTLKNLYSDLYLYGTEFTGGIVGSTWFDNTLTWDIDNCVFAGATPGKNAGTLMGRDSAHSSKNSGTIKNCYVPVGTKAISSNSSAVVETGDQAYIQTGDVTTNIGTGISTVNARLLGVIDAADLESIDSVGMKVTVTHTDLSTDTKTTYDTKVLNGIKGVFETINADGVEINVSEQLSGDYAYGVVLKNIPAGADDQVTITVVITRVVDGVELESVCSYNATLVSGAVQPQ